MAIHPTAIINQDAIIHESSEIGPYVIIEGQVKIGKNNHIMAGAFIGKNTTIGDGNKIHMYAIVGHMPQDLSFKGDETYLTIGNNNVIREHASIHRGCDAGTSTTIGNNCLLMGGCHIAHDCHLKNSIIIANSAGIAGHVEIDDRAFVSGGSMVHQFVKIGRLAILSGNSRISMDVPPFIIAGERNQTWGINVIGLRRAGYPRETISELKKLFRLFFRANSPRNKAVEKIRQQNLKYPEAEEFLKFVENSKRGICRYISEKITR